MRSHQRSNLRDMENISFVSGTSVDHVDGQERSLWTIKQHTHYFKHLSKDVGYKTRQLKMNLIMDAVA